MAERHFRGLGVKVVSGNVYSAGFTSRLLGPLEGAEASVQTRRSHRVGAAVDATLLLGPIGMLASVTKKDLGTAVIAFADGSVHTTRLDGKLAIRAAAEHAAGFNAMTRAGQVKSPAVRVIAQPVPQGNIRMADFSAEQQFLIWRAKAALQSDETAVDAAAGMLEGVSAGRQLPPCPAAIVITSDRVLIQFDRTGGYKRLAYEYRELSAAGHEPGGESASIMLETSADKLRLSQVPDFIAARATGQVRERITAAGRKPSADVPEETPAIRQQGAFSLADEIRKFSELHAEGILTDEEYAAKKAELLDAPSRSEADWEHRRLTDKP